MVELRFRARLKGNGAAEVAAYGIPDAEHVLDRELARAWPGARLDIREVHRTDPAARIVESFRLRYLLTLDVEVEAVDEKSARSAAFVAARGALIRTRFERVEWDAKVAFLTLPKPPEAAPTVEGGGR